MKRIISTSLLCTLLLFCILLCSCQPADSSLTETTDTAEVTAAQTKAQLADAVIFSGGKSDYTIIRSDKANTAIADFATKLCSRLNSSYGVALKIKTDFLLPTQIYNPDSYEIIIGESTREESIRLYEDIKKSDTSCYKIRVDGHKLLIGGTDEYMIYCALGYIIKDLIVTGSDGGAQLILPAGYDYTAGYDIKTPTPENIIESGADFSMYPIEQVASLPTRNNFSNLQGGGSDGTYAYYGLIDTGTDTALIVKFDIATWKVVKVSDPLPTAHTNDITYNSKLGLLVVCNSKDSWRGISFIDPETLTQTDYKVAIGNRGIEYLPATDQYIIGSGYTFTLTDSQFNILFQFQDTNQQYTTQGLCCDGKYIYDVRYLSKQGTNYITINTLDGQYKGTATLANVKGEPENMFRSGNYFYIGFNATHTVHKAILLPTNWWE